MANDFGDFSSLVPSGSSESTQDFGDFSSLVPQKPTGVSPMAETEGGAALMYPTGKRRAVAEPTDINLTKVAESVFGKGTPVNVPESERIAKIGETALATGALTAGAKAASPYLIGGGEAVSKLPGLPAKALGGAMVAGGTLAQRIGPREVAAMTTAGGAGESTEQVLSMAGLPREYQVLGSMGITGLAQLATQYPAEIANYLTTGIRGSVPKLIRSLGINIDDQATATANRMRTEAIDKAKADLLAGSSPEASKVLGEALQGGIAAKQQAQQTKAIVAQQVEKNQIEKLRGIQTTQAKAQQQAIQDAERQQVNFGASVPTESLANNLQADVVMTQKPLLDLRKANYERDYTQAVASAEAKEASGQFWQDTEGGVAVQKYWKDKIANKKLGTDSEKAVREVLNSIYRKTATTVEEEAALTKADKIPRSITGIDETIRMLGDKASREASGYGAISTGLAQELRKSITEGTVKVGGKEQKLGDGIYNWEPNFGKAKQEYAKLTEDLAAWETKSAQKTLGDETKSLSVLNQYFTSRKGFNNLVSELGGDEAKAAQYGTQYAVNQVKDKTPAQIDKWIASPKNGWIKDVPGLEDKIKGYAQTVGGLETKAARAGETVKRLEKEIPQLQANQKTWNANVDKWAQDHTKDIINGARPEDVFANILTSKKAPTETQIKALASYIGQSPEARKVVPDAVRIILSKESPSTIMNTFDTRIAPTLEATGLIKRAELGNLKQQAMKIYEADVKDYTIAKDKKTINAINFLYGILAQRAASQLTPTPQEQQ
jgi:hypothetical protein